MAKDRISIPKHVKDALIDEVDKGGYLSLGPETVTPRTELYMFAAALGYEFSSIPSQAKGFIGFVLMKSVPSRYESIMAGVHLNHVVQEHSLELIGDEENMISLMDSYAAKGFELLEERMASANGNREDIIWAELDRLDAKYKQLGHNSKVQSEQVVI